jgi:hypothetical protein
MGMSVFSVRRFYLDARSGTRGGSVVRGSGFGVQGSGFRVQGSGFRVQGSGFRVQGSGFRVQGSAFGVQRSEFGVRSASGSGHQELSAAQQHPFWLAASLARRVQMRFIRQYPDFA